MHVNDITAGVRAVLMCLIGGQRVSNAPYFSIIHPRSCNAGASVNNGDTYSFLMIIIGLFRKYTVRQHEVRSSSLEEVERKTSWKDPLGERSRS